ncbi:hypothetical protein [Virgibacillus senegalensis]|nr:hypothetical protein [Virgibacillus senegalensis]
MKEIIGKCSECEKTVYCRDGFFDGIQYEGKLICPDCAERMEYGEQ